MFKPKNINERIRHRLKISLGHLDKVLKMAEGGAYCIDVIHQSQAVQRALREVDHLVLENHLKTCAAKAIRKGDDRKAIREIMSTIKKA